MVWPGKTSDGVLPGLFFGMTLARADGVMRDHDEGTPKQPRPLRVPKKGSNSLETSEETPWRAIKDLDRDRHRHI